MLRELALTLKADGDARSLPLKGGGQAGVSRNAPAR